MLSFIQQSQQGSVSTLDRSAVTTVADNMVLQSFDLGLGCGGVDNMPPYIGDYPPSAFYTELDSTIYSQGKHRIRIQTVEEKKKIPICRSDN